MRLSRHTSKRCRASRSSWRRRRRRSGATSCSDALASARASVDATDEAALAERAGHRRAPRRRRGANIKITTPEDLPMAEAIAARRSSRRSGTTASRATATGRAGTGYDLHRLVDGPAADPGRRDDPVRPRARSATRTPTSSATRSPTRFSAPRASATSAATFPTPIRAWKDASSLDLLRRAVGAGRRARDSRSATST